MSNCKNLDRRSKATKMNREGAELFEESATASPLHLNRFNVEYSTIYHSSPLRSDQAADRIDGDGLTSPSHLFTSPTNLFNQSTAAEALGNNNGVASLKRLHFMRDILAHPSSPTNQGAENAFARLKRQKLTSTPGYLATNDESDRENFILSELDNAGQLALGETKMQDDDDDGKRLFRELSELNDAKRAATAGLSSGYKKSTAVNFKQRPREGKYYEATSFDGRKHLFFPQRKYPAGLPNKILESATRVNPLIPPSVLRSSVFRWMDEIEREKLSEAISQSKRLAGLHDNRENSEDESDEKSADDSRLWAEKYRPQRFIELISDEWLNTEILKWVKHWDRVVFGLEPPKQQQPQVPQNRSHGFLPAGKTVPTDKLGRPEKKILLLTGPPGLGKTTLAHVIARQCNYNAVEVNASDERTADVLKNSILHSIESRSVFGDKKPNLIVIDEIDGAMGGQSDTSLIKFLVDLASRGAGRRAQGVNEVDDESEEEGSPQGATKVRAATGKKKKMPLQRPIICICNDAYVPALRPLRQIAQIYNLRKPEASVLAKRLKCICDLEGLKADMRALVTLCEKADCDVRTCLNTLQFLKSNSGGNRKFKISTEVIKEAPVGHKDCQKSLFSIWHDIFYVPPSKKNSANFSVFDLLRPVESHGEYDKLMNGCFENYLNMKFREQHGFGSNIVQLHEYLNFYDLLSSKMHFGGNGLFAYVPYVFCVFNRLCSHIGNPNMLKLEYPRADAQAFMARRTNESVISSVLSHVDSRVMSWIRTGRCLILDVLSYLLRIMSPAIRPVNIQLLKAKEKAVLNRLVRIMASFRLNYIQVSVVESSGSGNSSVGGYTFKLEPPMDQMSIFQGLKDKQTLLPQAYTVRQMIAHEIELELLQQKERLVEKRMGKRQAADGEEKTAAVEEKPLRDFFGRIIEKPTEEEGSQDRMDLDSRSNGFKVMYKYHEGYSNAVRRPVVMSVLLKRYLKA